MAQLGVNVAGRAEYAPGDIGTLGARWARCVAYPDANIRTWMQGCHDRGVKVLLVLASESIGQDPGRWRSRIGSYVADYSDLADAWQIGNEPDHVSPSSWTMTQADLSHLYGVARNVAGVSAYLVGAGLASGHPDWLQGVDLTALDAIACHPYAKEPHSAELRDLLNGYLAYKKPLWVTEYHARTLGMAAYLKSQMTVQVALAFCYSDSMVEGFGMIEDRAALADFKGAAGVAPIYVLGFKTWHDRDPSLLGDPLENERGGVPGFSVQKTAKGRLMACNLIGRGWTLTFWRDSDGSRWLDRGDRSEQIA